ncbi:MAG: phosphoadenylyl-sulfate reductase [Betaproteobacteria bacterium]
MKPQLWKITESSISKKDIEKRNEELHLRLAEIIKRYKAVKFATSLAAEDMVITHAIARSGVSIQLFTLNTGRLHEQTKAMIAKVKEYYQIDIEELHPSAKDVESYIGQFGLNGFYESEDAKKACCGIRKVNVLNLALTKADAWITGQRKEQAVTRAELEFFEDDLERGIGKFNPLFDWSEKEVWSYLSHLEVPIHPLHRQGYPSIGCEPCSRAVKEGEDVRAGRWWWLQQESKECGLHVQESQT